MSYNKSSIDQEELDKFNQPNQDWWDLEGEFKPLHEINPVRMEYIQSVIRQKFGEAKGLDVLDVGCGGGLSSVSMANAGCNVTGLDANKRNIDSASKYANSKGLEITYINTTIEEYVQSSEQYDVILCLEVIEHVAHPEEFIRNVAKLVKKGGTVIFSTINRTHKAYLLAIIMAEYVLRWVPRKTHNYSKFVKPSEFANMAQDTSLSLQELKGLSLSPITQNWYISDDIDVNYFVVFSN
ncbi:MAG: bifunctional 2-polyprenyl-6-hydroxyphenol methylase/3-demethylubiquinol 3-O-methyltransferase UbiG [Rickettsiaceae bacterium]|nr:bifunctional 2-polyprenyl-6-hydroxyphenol methylase/3-demethylubiquinol 3-O-methyltransferase UbiG [Rickettsiaceae bacterium]